MKKPVMIIPCPKCGHECNGQQGLVMHTRWMHSVRGRAKLIKAAKISVEIKSEKRKAAKATEAASVPMPLSQRRNISKGMLRRSARRKGGKPPRRALAPLMVLDDKVARAIPVRRNLSGFPKLMQFMGDMRVVELALEFHHSKQEGV